MPRTAIAAQTPRGPYSTAPTANQLDITYTAADASNSNTTPFIGNRMLVTGRNSGAGARTITITSIADSHGRTGDITTYSIGAGEYFAYVVEREGWQQSDGALYITAEHAEVLIAVLAIP